MVSPLTTALYAGLSGLWLLLVSLNVVRHRARAGVGLGDGGDTGLLRAIRIQGNTVEYVPMTLLLLAIAEMLRAPIPLIHIVGIALLVGRVLHAVGLSRSDERSFGRAAGMLLTWGALLAAALLVLYIYVVRGPG